MFRGLLLFLSLAVLSGCETAAEMAGGRLFHEARPFSVRYTETAVAPANWTTFRSIQIGQITAGYMHGAVPPVLLSDLQPYAQQELADESILQSRGKTLLVTGEITDFYEGSSKGLRMVGFGDNPALTIHAKFTDRATGKVLSEVVLVSQSKSLRDWEEMVSRGLGHSLANYLDSKGIHKTGP
jgi:hypothetical protein